MRRFALTPGEPSGIGPDLALMLDASLRGRMVVVADPLLIKRRMAQLGIEVSLRIVDAIPPVEEDDAALSVLPVALGAPVTAGRLDSSNAAYVLETLRQATARCLSGDCCALVTGPVHKGVINEAGQAFTGHTEFLAALAGIELPVMMLSAPGLRVALVTTHLALRAVADAIDATRLESTIRILVGDLQTMFGIERPKVIVCGLNPHAGEGGHLGTEELEIISPVLTKLRAQGMHLDGPTPADTAFTPARLAGADAVLAMYHDQGLPVLKHAGFGEAVNITLGLPFIRTSVDHGTALDLAGTGRIDVGSLETAARTALEMAAAAARRREYDTR